MDLIWTFALYEFKLLLRSRLFRLFAFISVAVQATVTAFIYFVFKIWSFRAIPSSLPYTAVIVFNALTAIGGILIVTEFIHRDMKLGTTDTVYYRSFSTPLYFLGETIGILAAIFSLEALILLIPLGTSLFFLTDTSISLAGYLLYPLLLTLPLLLFLTGVSWLLMLITKSQPVTFIAGIILFAAIVWVNRITSLHHLFDYPALRVPALYSSFIGFGNTNRLLMQRGIFAFTGIGLMALSSLLLPRLSQSRSARRYTAFLSVFTIVAGITAATVYIGDFTAGTTLRNDLRALNHEYGSIPRVTMTGCDLTVSHNRDTISAEAAVSVINKSDMPLDTYFFSLNPGLAVESVTGPTGDLPFSRNNHLLFITPVTALTPGMTDSLVITYAGTIDDDICYLDIPEPERTDSYSFSVMTVDRLYGCITPDCVLLTPETLWYPQAGVPYGSTFPELGQKDFPQFSLTVETDPGLVAVSQGLPETQPDGRTKFIPATPLSQLSLSIAAYEMKSVAIDSVLYSLYNVPGHDKITPYIEDYVDDLAQFVREQQENMERNYLRPYPFDYYNLVEVPIHFSPPQRLWTVVQDNIQPGITMISEHGIFMQDVRRMMESLKEALARSNMPTDQMSRTILLNALYPLFNDSYNSNSSSSSNQIPLLSLSTLYRFLGFDDPFISNPFPNFYSFTNHLHSERWPVIDSMIERYLAFREEMSANRIYYISSTLSTADNANMQLAGRSLADILSTGGPMNMLNAVMSAKVNQLFAAFSARIGGEDFSEQLTKVLDDSRYSSESFTMFLDMVSQDGTDAIERFIEEWYHATALPICLFRGITYTEVTENERNYYQVQVTLMNPSPTEGLFQISAQSLIMNPQGTSGSLESYDRYVTIPGGEARCVSIVSENSFYREVIVDTMVSQNLPSRYSITLPDVEQTASTVLIDSILTVDPQTLQSDPGVIIVDDLSPGCEVCDNTERSFLRDFLFGKEENDQQFGSMMFFNAGDQWTQSIESSFYGEIIKSGYYKSPGEGDQPVIWHAEIVEPGTYDVYTHGCRMVGGMVMMDRDREPRPIVGTLSYTVNHDDGSNTIEIQQSGQSDEWVYLGTFYFSAGEASVELSDKSDGMMIYADAIKWVKQ